MKVLYTVETGCYSDHRILCVCATKAEAEAIAARVRTPDIEEDGRWWPDSDAEVGEILLVSGDIDRTPTLQLTETLWDDGTTSRLTERLTMAFPWDWNSAAAPVQWRWVRAPMHENKGGRLEVSGTDLERVRKVFSDRRAELLAVDHLRKRKEARG